MRNKINLVFFKIISFLLVDLHVTITNISFNSNESQNQIVDHTGTENQIDSD